MNHAELLRALLPEPYGAGLQATGAPRLAAELAVEGAALDNILARGDALLAELDPRTTSELLADWERMAGLPDPCVVGAGVTQTVPQRQAALVARLSMVAGQSRAFFIALAASLGYSITISEWWDYPGGTGDPAGGITGVHVWRVNAAATNVREFTAGSMAGEPLRTWGNELLECVLSRFAPAHTTLLFGYV